MLRKACAEAARWPDDIKVAVNLSPVQFTNQNLVPTVISALAAAGLPASRLELEITEAVLLQNTEATLATLHQSARPRRAHLDGRFRHRLFVAELSAQLPVRQDQDRPLASSRDLGTATRIRVAIVRAVTRAGASLGMTTTAEGVETKEQLELVRAEGCTEMQGYLFSRPRPAAEVPRMLARLGRKRRAAA